MTRDEAQIEVYLLTKQLYESLLEIKGVCVRSGHRPGIGKIKAIVEKIDWAKMEALFEEEIPHDERHPSRSFRIPPVS